MFKSHKIIIISILILSITFCTAASISNESTNEEIISDLTTQIDISETTLEPTTEEVTTLEQTTEEVTFLESETKLYSESDIELLARICMAEAENQCEYGQRLVIDCVLNRKDSKSFPNTIREVIFQKGQFSPITNGRWERCYAMEKLKVLAKEEIENRTNNSILYFNEGYYPRWATPVCCVENHYFSK